MIAREPKQVDRHLFEQVMRLLADHPELTFDQLRVLVEQDGTRGRRNRAEKIRPRNAGELVALVQTGLLTKFEAKRYLDIPRARATATKGGR